MDSLRIHCFGVLEGASWNVCFLLRLRSRNLLICSFRMIGFIRVDFRNAFIRQLLIWNFGGRRVRRFHFVNAYELTNDWFEALERVSSAGSMFIRFACKHILICTTLCFRIRFINFVKYCIKTIISLV